MDTFGTRKRRTSWRSYIYTRSSASRLHRPAQSLPLLPTIMRSYTIVLSFATVALAAALPAPQWDAPAAKPAPAAQPSTLQSLTSSLGSLLGGSSTAQPAQPYPNQPYPNQAAQPYPNQAAQPYPNQAPPPKAAPAAQPSILQSLSSGLGSLLGSSSTAQPTQPAPNNQPAAQPYSYQAAPAAQPFPNQPGQSYPYPNLPGPPASSQPAPYPAQGGQGTNQPFSNQPFPNQPNPPLQQGKPQPATAKPAGDKQPYYQNDKNGLTLSSGLGYVCFCFIHLHDSVLLHIFLFPRYSLFFLSLFLPLFFFLFSSFFFQHFPFSLSLYCA